MSVQQIKIQPNTLNNPNKALLYSYGAWTLLDNVGMGTWPIYEEDRLPYKIVVLGAKD